MKRYIFGVLLFLGVVIIPMTMFGQEDTIADTSAYDEEEEYGRVYMGEFNLSLAAPTGKLDQRVDNLLFGVYGSFFMQYKPEEPLFFGVHLGYQYIDSYSDNFINFSVPDPYDLKSSTTTGLFFLTLSPRFYTGFRPKGVQTYIEADIGAHIIYTSTSTSALDFDETSFTFNESDFSLRYGVAFGAQYNLYETLYLNVKVGYQTSLSSTFYYHDKDLPFNNISSTFDLFSRGSGPLSAIGYHLGVTNTF